LPVSLRQRMGGVAGEQEMSPGAERVTAGAPMPVSIFPPYLLVEKTDIQLSSGGAASWSAGVGRLDLKPGIVQPLDNDLGRVFGVKDLRREVAAAEEVGQNVLRSELAHGLLRSPCQAA
jgi:hypothetical protein